MMNKKITTLIITLSLISCNNKNTSKEVLSHTIQPIETVLTEKEQAALSPEDVLDILKKGNKSFLANTLTTRNHSEQVINAASGQYPKAIILSCVDSRVPVEDIFDRGIGDIFVARVAGNFVNEDILGSMEFACGSAKARLIVVMGHESCGAIRAAIDTSIDRKNNNTGNIGAMVSKIWPAIDSITTKQFKGERSSQINEFVHMVCESNVRNTINEIRTRSSLLNSFEKETKKKKHRIKIVGAIYNLRSGKVEFLPE